MKTNRLVAGITNAALVAGLGLGIGACGGSSSSHAPVSGTQARNVMVAKALPGTAGLGPEPGHADCR